jgi:asparagine synthase (glutamine-hydrolysing)
MCGIVGFLNRDPTHPADPARLRRMNDALVHRGPDDAGERLDGPLALAMRRLSIIDRAGGHQPLTNEAGDIWIVFNGEIYTHASLRSTLEARGHGFRTHSDTEAIVHAYEEWGDDCVLHLRGMFAFALWDGPRRRLLLARDRVGKKPLYYAETPEALAFASEVGALLQHPAVPRQPDPGALFHYLSLQYVPDPLTGLQGVHKLPPAHRLVWENGAAKITRYWCLDYEPKWTDDAPTLRARVRAALEEAVEIRRVGEVPLGVHLSGGIDSSLVTALLARGQSQTVRTFSIAFDPGGFDETEHALAVARQYATDHTVFRITPDAAAVLPQMVGHFGEPFADPAALPTWYLARETRRSVTVALNGDGGDEAFAGYQRYAIDRYADLLRRLPRPLRALAARLLGSLRPDPDQPLERNKLAALQRLFQAAELPRSASILRWGSYWGGADKQNLLQPAFADQAPTSNWLSDFYTLSNARHPVDRTLNADFQTYLPGALLPKVDRMTMAHSLEARSPFLDHPLLELAARLPVGQKLQGSQGKRILKEAFADLLPRTILRRSKQGFAVPLDAWFRGPLESLARDTYLASDARLRAWCRPEAVLRFHAEHRDRRADHGKRLYALLMLELWARWLETLPPGSRRSDGSV